jgi:hypothetical protein
VDPGFATNSTAHLQSNVRHWRNIELGAYFQDDWKIKPRLTLSLGLRYDLFTRHNEENGLATTFLLGPGNDLRSQILAANTPAGTGTCTSATQITQVVLAGVCGPGGFAKASSLGAGDHNDFGPRVGFAYDVFGNGRTSLRGGFGVSYEGTLYNPLSNSRWNPPYYSFNIADNDLFGGASTIIYGPVGGGSPTFTGAAPAGQNSGTGAQATGNISGWAPANPQTANLTGIIFPGGIKDPYVMNFHLSVQHELIAKTVVEVDYVGTQGRKLFRAVNINTFPGNRLPAGTTLTNNIGEQLTGLGRRFTNPNYGNLRNWENTVSSNYNALQLQLKKQASHGISFNLNYTWSHALDGGSTWHSGATTANGAAGGEGYLTDTLNPGLDYGNSIFDIRHRIVTNYVWELPTYAGSNGFMKAVLGGYRLTGIIAYQSGAHWSPYCSSLGGCDYNKDGVANDRPNSRVSNFTPTKQELTMGWFNADSTLATGAANALFSAPCLGCVGNLRRNQFVGPGYVSWDPSLLKTFKATERINITFRADAFNVLNHTNFNLPGSNGAAHNRINDVAFGQAGGAFNPRQLQFGLRIAF